MKKTYEKPQILFCSFELSESISAGCASIANMDEDACPVEIPGWGETYITPNDCDNSDPMWDDMICYHVPSEDYNVFTS